MRHRAPFLFWWVVVAVTLGILGHAAGAGAQDCPAVDDLGDPRDCTFTERYGECLVTAYESYTGCVGDSDDWFDRAVCEGAVQIDLLACHASLPWEIIREIGEN